VPYRFQVDRDVFTSDDLTLGEQCDIERRLGFKFALLDPVQEAIPRQAFIVAWLSRRMSVEEATAAADALTARQVIVDLVEDDRPVDWSEGVPVVDPKGVTDAPEMT
jgi:hypothetical protein